MGNLELALNRVIKEQDRFRLDGKDDTCKVETLLTKYHVSLHIVQWPHGYTKNKMVQTDTLDQSMVKSIFDKTR